jgi:hypothetical protein
MTKVSVLAGKFLHIFNIAQCFFLIEKTPALRSAGGEPHVPENYPEVLYVEKDRAEPHYTGIYYAAFPRWRSWARESDVAQRDSWRHGQSKIELWKSE